MKSMTLSLRPAVLIATIAISLTACKKNNGPSDPPQQPANEDGPKMTTFLKQNGPQFETFTVDATAGGTITTSKGTKFVIPAGAFVTSTGVAVTGSVNVSVKEVRTVADMLLSDKPTLTHDGRMLQSYGEFFVKAVQNDQNLQLKKDSAIKVAVAAKAAGIQEVPMWSGDSTVSTTLSGYDYQNIAVTVPIQVAVRKGIDWTQVNSSYAFFNASNGTLNFGLDSLIKWKNCDQILNVTDPKTTVLCYFNSNYNNLTTTDYMGDQPTMLYFKPHNQNTLIKFYDIILNATGTYQGFISYENTIPVGMQGTFLAMSTQNGKFYAEMKDVTIAAPVSGKNYTTFTFDPQEISETDLVGLIQQLNSK